MIEEGIAKIEALVRSSMGVTPAFAVTTLGDGHPVLVARQSEPVTLIDLEKYFDSPFRKRANMAFVAVASFVEYVNDHKDDQATILTGSADSGWIKATIDGDQRGVNNEVNGGWKEHNAMLKLGDSPDWKRWEEAAGEWMTQEQLAEFLEEMDHTVVEPDGATLIELVEKLKITSDRRFESSVNRTSGKVSLTYVDDVSVKGEVKFPEKLSICVAPFAFADPVDMLVHLRYRLREGSVRFCLKMHRPDVVKREAFDAVCAIVKDAVGLSVLLV